MYIVTQLMKKDEKESLMKTFIELDKNGDGKLSTEELIQGYTKLYKDETKAKKVVENIMSNVDIDNNGSIDYSGIYKTNSRIFVSFSQYFTFII